MNNPHLHCVKLYRYLPIIALSVITDDVKQSNHQAIG
jgi:hypothetical protein